jgi:prepilin-type N-terminal cleavage/methylation domain-containing protein
MSPLERLRERLSDESGFTLAEMIVVVAIMGIVIAGLTQLFISGSRAEVNLSNRFQAQQQSRLALDALRREIHCASGVTAPSYPATAITITLASSCATAGGGTTVVWCTQQLNANGGTSAPLTNRYLLWRYATTGAVTCGTTTGGSKRADYLSTGSVFTMYYPATACTRGKLSVDLPVRVSAGGGSAGVYELRDDIVLRNVQRASGCYLG